MKNNLRPSTSGLSLSSRTYGISGGLIANRMSQTEMSNDKDNSTE